MPGLIYKGNDAQSQTVFMRECLQAEMVSHVKSNLFWRVWEVVVWSAGSAFHEMNELVLE